jgi:hypothetical protein
MSDANSGETDLRQRAVLRLKKRAEFQTHARVFALVNGLHVAIWAVTGAGFFWPIFPLLGWSIGLAFHARNAFRLSQARPAPTEDQIRQEMDALRRLRSIPSRTA